VPERKTVHIALAANAAIAVVAWDAAGALVVGGILVYVAYLLARDYKELLIGAGARPAELHRIRGALERHPGVDEVIDLRTMYLGPESLLGAARVDLADDGRDAEGIEHLANDVDRRLREEVPEVSEVFLDPTPR
jgi:divalent metal cation (Fe/Co/Zn/Cd) transporter